MGHSLCLAPMEAQFCTAFDRLAMSVAGPKDDVPELPAEVCFTPWKPTSHVCARRCFLWARRPECCVPAPPVCLAFDSAPLHSEMRCYGMGLWGFKALGCSSCAMFLNGLQPRGSAYLTAEFQVKPAVTEAAALRIHRCGKDLDAMRSG